MTEHTSEGTQQLPGNTLDAAKMPAHWLFARLGKRVLRPGGLQLTNALLDNLAISSSDRVVEMAPGLGATTRLLIGKTPASYTGVERDPDAAQIVQRLLKQPGYTCRVGTAQSTGLSDSSADIVFGEAYLTMQPESVKRRIMDEVFRILESGGRYSVHELAILPDSVPEPQQEKIRSDFVDALRVGARPLTVTDWQHLLADAGFEIAFQTLVPFKLLHPRRVIADEGLARAIRFFAVAASQPAVRTRMKQIRSCFREHESQLCAIGIVARKP